ncbi:FAD-binding domain-containing protein [Dendrothele bispora CBS 962.96]|uniref:FAD-binding domain-containing protein n=1 Tax=Dendrothele bispora (strain CBS 962.96) TaxID=1314807 RepID=A0A4S8MMG9_DENBC|nr:FAD-binding domain-containing protein [Dendrothele bispora CBS 962.96]
MWTSPPKSWLFFLSNIFILSYLSSTCFALDFSSNNANLACSQARTSLGESIVQGVNDSDYQSAAEGYWNLFNTEFNPTCIVFPRQSSHVQIAMRSIFEFDVDYAIQAGGHSGMKGWNNVNSGILISFKFMNHISYEPSRDTITLEPGIRWGESVNALEPQGVSPVGGRVDDVGTGLLLGGGISFLSPAHGYAADNYVELDVVLVNGTLVTATESNQYSDLFRTLKGGANRFGIVTRYEVRAIHTGRASDKTWFGGLVTYPNTSFDAVARAVSHYTRDVDDPKAAILIYYGAIVLPDDTMTNFIGASFYYNGTELPDHIFGELLSIPTLSTSFGPLSWHDITFSLSEPLPSNGHGQLFEGTALAGGEDDLYEDVVRHWVNFTKTFTPDFNTSVLAFTPIPLSQTLIGRERGGNVIDPPLVPYNSIHVQVTLPFGIPQISPEMEEGRQLFLKQAPRSPGLPLYINECDAKQNVFETYGQYDFLKETHSKYDPTRFNIRHTNGPIGL